MTDELISNLLENGIFLTREGDTLKVKYNGDAISNDLLLEIKKNKQELLDYLGREQVRSDYKDIAPLQGKGPFRVSSAQHRLWILSQFEEGSVAYNIPRSIELTGEYDIDSFKRAVNAVIDRHEILRTVFKADQTGEVTQWVLSREEIGFAIDYVDFRKEADKEELVQSYIEEDSLRPFKLEEGPLLRAALLRVADKEFVFFFNMHHIISDGSSLEVLSKDVFAYYHAFRENRSPDLKDLRIQYKDYSAWQLAQLEDGAYKHHEKYWLDKLSGDLPILDLPGTKKRPKLKTNNGQGLKAYIGQTTTTKLKKYTQENGGSLFIALLSAWNVLMFRYTSQTDIITGTPIVGRDHSDLENQIGFYVNTLALRSEINPEENFHSFYQKVKENTIQSYNHQMYPFDRLVEDLNLQRDTSRSVVFDIMLNLHNNREKTKELTENSRAIDQIVETGKTLSKFEIDIDFEELDDFISMDLVYNPDVYDQEFAEGLITHFKQLLSALFDNPEEKVAKVDYLTEKEKSELLIAFNDTEVDYAKDKTVIDLFEYQVEKTPDNVAILFEKESLTYQELNERSNQLADYLRSNYEVHPNDLIGIKQDRSEWMLISILGVLKAGGAYVPVDPAYPQERIDMILEDSKSKLLIDQQEVAKFRKNQNDYSTENKSTSLKPESLAYVIYTSGSTGRPKGVMIDHHSLLNYLSWGQAYYSNNGAIPLDFGVFTSSSFDLTITSLYLPLISGRTAHVYNGSTEISALLKDYFQRGISCIKLTPAHVSLLGNLDLEQTSVSLAIVGGDNLNASHIKILRRLNPDIRIYNEYGPTESTVGCIVCEIDSEDDTILIGKPIANTQIYVLNEQQDLQPVGVSGEICIGGDGLARGYRNRATLTQEKFIPNPFKEGEIIYKTGDLGRWLHDGNIEFLGRKDDQVKVRGYRIELGEIEYALSKHHAIEQVVVLAKENETGEKELVAYLSSKEELIAGDLRSYLKDSLPQYMLPTYFVQLDEFPLTPNGKVNRKSLPDPEGLGMKSGVEYVAPRNELEEKLVVIWEEALQRENIGVRDDFFELGGHSLKAIRLINDYQKEFEVKLSMDQLFVNSTVELHRELIRSSENTTFTQIERQAEQESYPISDAQRRLWVLSQFEEDSVSYNTPGHTSFNEDVNIEAFKRAIDSTIERHEILRTVFREDENGEIRQWILNRQDLNFEIDYKDLRNEQNKEAVVQSYIEEDSYSPFDLEKGPLIRAGLLQIGDEEYVFYFNMHHIISDGWSLEVLSKDVFTFYEAFKENRKPELKDLRIQYRDYSAWQLEQLGQESFNDHRTYWLDYLSGELPLLDLPASKQRPRLKTNNGYALSTYISQEASSKLKEYSQENGGSLFMGLLAIWNVLMHRYTSQKDIITGTPIVGREHADLQDQIGFYVNTLVLRNQVNPKESFNELFNRVKENTLSSYEHQSYPFDRLVDELGLQRDTSRNAVFDVMLTLQNIGENRAEAKAHADVENHIVDLGNTTSRFDLGINFQEIDQRLYFHGLFNPDVYEKSMLEGLINHFKQLVDVLLKDPTTIIGEVDFLSDEESGALLRSVNDSEEHYPTDKTVVDLFQEQVERRPDQLALIFEDKEITYQELNEQSNRIAHYLRKSYAIKPDDLIAFRLERSERLIITILAILKAGAAYLPIDIDSPAEKTQYVVNDSQCILLIDEDNFKTIQKESSTGESTNLSTSVQPKNLIYSIYTSGSTGFPKGVLIEHQNIVAHIHNVKNLYGVSEKSRFLQFFNIAFDAAAQEIFTVLSFGARLYVKTSEQSPEYIFDLISKNKITHADFSTAFFNSLMSAFNADDFSHQLEFCAIGGEKLEKGMFDSQSASISSFTKDFYNVYGPTETTLIATYFPIIVNGERRKIEGTIPIGKPYPGRHVLILNDSLNLQPVGVTGEICIGGDSLARGYLNREELTNKKFVENPFVRGERIYKTGDLGRLLPDGNIEFLGRKDDQVKIRGYRIELGEVEHVLSKHQEIEQAVVLAKENESGVKELVAYLTSEQEQNTNGLRSFLKESLAEYMVPAYFVQLDEMPLTPNGKVDKKSLPNPQDLGMTSGVEYVAPSTEQEKALVSVWSDVLKRGGIGVKDNFYNLGGDSIKSIQVVARLKQHGYTLKVENILKTPVLEELALLIELTTRVVDQKEVTGSVELTPIQHWLFEADEVKVHHHFNQSVLLQSKEVIDPEVLEKCIVDLTSHHDALRMAYTKREDGTWEQFNRDTQAKSYTVNVYDLRQADDAVEQMSRLGEELQSTINLSEGPLFRVAHFKLKDGDRIGLIIHHLVVDGVSWRILLEDFSSLYASYKEGKEPTKVFKTDSFQRWAALQKEYSASDKLNKERAYWEELCSQEIMSLPLDKEPGESPVSINSVESFNLDKATTELLQTRVHSVYRTEINDVLLTGLGLAIKEVLKVGKSVLKMEGHGREEIIDGIDISRTVGWFTSMYPFVLDVSESSNSMKQLVSVKESLRSIPNKGIGYGMLKYLSPEGFENQLKEEVVFNYLGDFGSNASSENDIFGYASETLGPDSAKVNTSSAILEVAGIVVKGELGISIRYSNARFDESTIKNLVQSYQRHVATIITELAETEHTYLTPSDLSFKGLTQEELSTLNTDNMVEDVYELSPLQEGIYYHWLSNDSSSLYFEQTVYSVTAKDLQIEKLELAYQQLIQRHGVLRTSFSIDFGGRSLQIVRKEVEENFIYERINDQKDLTSYIEKSIQQDREKGFDLESGSQMRLHIMDLGEDKFEFIWSYHHIIMDGWCMSILMNDFNELLSAAVNGSPANLSDVRPYSDYVNMLREMDKQDSLSYWKAYLSDYQNMAEIPFKTGVEDLPYAEANEFIRIEGELFEKVENFCSEMNFTHNTFIQTVWGYLLSRYNNTNDVVFGAVVSGRPANLQGVEDMIGLFINTIPVRVKYEDQTARELLQAVQEQSIQSTEHHYLNLSEVQSQSILGKNLINHIMVFENFAVKEMTSEGVLNAKDDGGISIESIDIFEQTNYNLNLLVNPTSSFIRINLKFNKNYYNDVLMSRIQQHFLSVVDEFINNPNQTLTI